MILRGVNMDKKIPLKVVTTFSGIGFQEMGIRNTGLFDMEVVNTCELDTDAIISYAAIHNGLTRKMVETYLFYPDRYTMAKDLKKMNIGYDFLAGKPYDWLSLVTSADTNMQLETAWLANKLNKNVGDISRVDNFPYCDLLTFSFPCTDLSLAGRQAGMVKGETRSGLVYEVIRILQNMKELNVLPPFLLMENVDALVNKKNLPQFELLNEEFYDLGYDCKWDVINGKNCGVPQNRKRVFAIYWLRDKYNLSTFEFPKPYDTGIRLKDVLLKDVDDKYYITNERAQALIRDLVVNGKVKVDITKKSDESSDNCV
jgi:DNA (cytosine-5)-methyltransferase 1